MNKMKSTGSILLFVLAMASLVTPAFAQIGQQRGAYYNSSFGFQDQQTADGVRQDAPPLPAGNVTPPTVLPTPFPETSAPLPGEIVGEPEQQVMPPPAPRTPMDKENPKAALPQEQAEPNGWPADGAPVMNFNSSPMTMPAPYQQSPCCPDHAQGMQHSHSHTDTTTTTHRHFNLSDSVSQDSIIGPASIPSFNDSCGQCGDDCGGTCQPRMLGSRIGQFNRKPPGIGVNGASIGNGLGSNVGNVRSLFQDQPMYAFFDFNGFFSESESRFSNGMPGQASGAPFGHKDSFGFGAGLGQYITNDFRMDISARNRYVELENQLPVPGGQSFQVDGGSDVWTGMLNGRHNLPGIHPCIKPYLSVGAGLAYHRSQASTRLVGPGGVGPFQSHLNEETTEFAWSVGAGIAFKMTRRMFFDVDYQFIDFGDAATGPVPGVGSVLFEDLRANEVAFRLRFNF